MTGNSAKQRPSTPEPESVKKHPLDGVRNAALLLGLALLGMLLFVHLGHGQIQRLQAQPAWCYADTPLPLLTNLDGFYYLRQAERLQQNSYSAEDPLRWLPGPSIAPGVSQLLCWFSRFWPGNDLRLPALWLPLFLGGLLVLPLVLWGHRLGGWFGAVAALCFGLSMPAWHLATGAGRLDTGSLPPVLLLLAGLCLDAVLLRDQGRQAAGTWRWYVLLGVCLPLLGWWWPPGLLLAGLWLPALGGLALWRLRQHHSVWRLLGLIFGALLVVALALWLLSPQLYSWLAAHLALLGKGAVGSGQVGGSIAELRSPGLAGLLQLAGGSVAGGVAGGAGLLLLLWRTPTRLVVFAPLLAAAGLGIWAERFTPFAVPLAVLGLIVIVLVPLQQTTLSRLLPQGARLGLTVALFLGLLTPGARFSLDYTPRPEVTQGMDALALTLRESGNHDGHTLVWSWWDWGYFLQYRAGLRTLFDGGSQGRGTSFVAASPLASADDATAARWMRFFAKHGPGMFTWLANRLDGPEQAALWLQQAMADTQQGEKLLEQARLSHKDACDFLYPKTGVAVFLPVTFLGLAGQWLPLAAPFQAEQAESRDLADIFPAQGFSLIQGARPLWGELDTAATTKGWPKQLPGIDLQTTKLPQDVPASSQPLLLLTPDSPLAYVATGRVARSLGFRLLAPVHPRPQGFTPLLWRPETGGVWLLHLQPQN